MREASIFFICGCCCSVFFFLNFWGRLGTYVFKSHLQPIAKGEKIRRKTKWERRSFWICIRFVVLPVGNGVWWRVGSATNGTVVGCCPSVRRIWLVNQYKYIFLCCTVSSDAPPEYARPSHNAIIADAERPKTKISHIISFDSGLIYFFFESARCWPSHTLLLLLDELVLCFFLPSFN